jgi:dihydroorotate dehydrogenase electron transfer subunit
MVVDVDAEVVGNARLSADYNILSVAAPAIAAAARPGQFVMIKTSPGLEPLLRRPFSLFEITRDAAGRPTGFTLLSKRTGQGTTQLYEARPGDRVACLGPLGTPFDAVRPPAIAWMVAGGVGLAPFATLAEALHEHGTRTTLFYGARRAADLFCVGTFERLGIEVVTATEDGSAGERGFVTEPLGSALGALPRGVALQIYACGPTPMMRRVADLAISHDRSCVVSLEPVMGCGMGGCYSCVVRVRTGGGEPHFVRSCLAGPIFDARTVVWEDLVH